MNDQHKPSCEASSSQQTNGDKVCVNTDIQKDVTKGSVSRAVSPAISLANGGEKPITDTKSNKSGSQSRSQKPDCYKCVYRGVIPGDAHSCCNHPIFDAVDGGKFMPMFFMMQGLRSPFEKRLNITYNQHGFNNGWFMWPINFDPVWLNTCDGFVEAKNDG